MNKHDVNEKVVDAPKNSISLLDNRKFPLHSTLR